MTQIPRYQLTCIFPFSSAESQSAETGECYEHEPQRQTRRAAARRPASRNDGRSVRNQNAAARAHEVGGVLSIGGVGGQAGHGGDKARAGHGAAGEGGDRGASGVRRPSRGTHAPQEVTSSRTGSWPPTSTRSVLVQLCLFRSACFS